MKIRYKVGLLAFVLVAVFLSWSIYRRARPDEQLVPPAPVSVPDPNQPLPAPQQSAVPAVPGNNAGGSSVFASLSRDERAVFLTELSKRDATQVFREWIRAGRSERDLLKQSSIGAVLAGVVRGQPMSRDLSDGILEVIRSPTNTHQERADLIGVLAYAATPESIELLLRAHEAISDPAIRRIVATEIKRTGDLWGDGSRHTERSPALERAWGTASDESLLSSLADAIARIGSPTGVRRLIEDATVVDGTDGHRQTAAKQALRKVYSRSAIPGVSTFLGQQSGDNERSRIAGQILLKIGTGEAGRELVNWLRSNDASVEDLARMWVQSSQASELLNQWRAALDPNLSFRDERVRSAIGEALQAMQRQ